MLEKSKVGMLDSRKVVIHFGLRSIFINAMESNEFEAAVWLLNAALSCCWHFKVGSYS